MINFKKKRTKFHFREADTLLFLMLPATIILIINYYLPMFGTIMAFKDLDNSLGILKSPWVGLNNFKYLFSTDVAWRITRNTISYNIVFIVVGMFAAVSLAIVLYELRNKFASKVYHTILILPNFMSMIVISYIVYALLSPEYGVFNTILTSMGKDTVNWYNTPKYWPFILIITRLWATAGPGSIMYLATLTGIDTTLYEAAVVDGANKWQQIKNVTLPQLTPIMIIMLIISLGGIIRGDFGLFYQVPLNSSILYPVTDVLDTYVYRSLINLGDVGMSAAASLYQSIIGCIMVVLANLSVRKMAPEQALF